VKYLKVLGLAALAAMVVMAFGAGSASATTKICVSTPGTTDNECPANKSEPDPNNPQADIHVEGRLTNPPGAVLVTNITTVICEESGVTLTANGSTPETGATSITGEVTSLSFAKCKTSAGVPCTITVLNLPYESHLQGTIEGVTNTSSLTVTDPVGAGAKVVCGLVLNCTFTTKEATLHGKNITTPTTAEFTASNLPLEKAGGLCPATAEWNASYEVTTPSGFTVH